MSTTEYMRVERPAAMLAAMRQRWAEGSGHAIAFIGATPQGTSVPSFSQLNQTSVKDNPAAAKGGDASGLRLWRHPV